MTSVLDELSEIARSIEAHAAAIWRLEQRRAELQHQLRMTDWQPPKTDAG
jgi:hypothetical protein